MRLVSRPRRDFGIGYGRFLHCPLHPKCSPNADRFRGTQSSRLMPSRKRKPLPLLKALLKAVVCTAPSPKHIECNTLRKMPKGIDRIRNHNSNKTNHNSNKTKHGQTSLGLGPSARVLHRNEIEITPARISRRVRATVFSRGQP